MCKLSRPKKDVRLFARRILLRYWVSLIGPGSPSMGYPIDSTYVFKGTRSANLRQPTPWPPRDHNRPVPLNRVGKALGRLKTSMQSLQRKISRFPEGEMIVLMTCRKKDRKGQEAEEWAVFGSEALQRAFNPYLHRSNKNTWTYWKRKALPSEGADKAYHYLISFVTILFQNAVVRRMWPVCRATHALL